MNKLNLQIPTFDDALEFIQIAERIDSHLYVVQGDLKVNARSLLGIMSLNPNESAILELDGSEQTSVNARKAFQAFLVDTPVKV